MVGTKEATTAIAIIGIIIILLLETATLITTTITIEIAEEITGAGIIIMETTD